ncbi:hypothetical protein [Flavobacterium sp. N3904]|uniref:hypothetical protein n=1 Tax=Flavobacterium sp. N3904 TaxID=2986835 RepID=UPI00222527C7|nr:hypothetical protein [Flavobacterium sp. N3904]
MKKYNYFFYFFLFILISSCSKKNDKNIEKSIQNAIERFPQLKTTKKTCGNDYKLVKSVKNGEFDFEIQLFSEPDSIKDKQQIIVLINSKKNVHQFHSLTINTKTFGNFHLINQ